MTDVIADVKSKSETSMISIAKKVKGAYEDDNTIDLSTLLLGEDVLGDKYEICEINVVGADGIIKKSTEANNIVGFDFYSPKHIDNKQVQEFILFLEDENTPYLVQDFTTNAIDEERKYASIRLDDGEVLQIAYNKVQFRNELDSFIVDVTKNRHVGATGFIAVCDENLKIVSETDINDHHVSEIGIIPSNNMEKGDFEEKIFETEIINPYNGKSQGKYSYVYTFKEGYCIIAAMPEEEITIMRDASMLLSAFM
jgi:hypothetical protein